MFRVFKLPRIFLLIVFFLAVASRPAQGGDAWLSPRPGLAGRLSRAFLALLENNGQGLSQNVFKDKNVLFVSFRLDHSDLDGVSLETKKWAEIIDSAGGNVFYYSGQTKLPGFVSTGNGHSYVLAHFKDKDVSEWTNGRVFQEGELEPKDMVFIETRKEEIKQDLKEFVRTQKIDLIVSENVNGLPINIPLGLALIETKEEMGLPMISHFHDFFWERERFRVRPGSGLEKMLERMVGGGEGNQAVVINSFQSEELWKRYGIRAVVAPNVMNFESPSRVSGEQVRSFRQRYGIGPNEELLLLPVRPVGRKNLGQALKLAERLLSKGRKIRLMLTHPAGDEGTVYWESIRTEAARRKIPLIYAPGAAEETLDLATAYAASDIVVYLSEWEGWGNVLAEACYYKKPVVVYQYPVYLKDIKPLGVKFIEVGEIDESAADRVISLLDSPRKKQEMVEHNFRIGRQKFSYGLIYDLLQQVGKDLFRIMPEPQDSGTDIAVKEISPIQGLLIDELNWTESSI